MRRLAYTPVLAAGLLVVAQASAFAQDPMGAFGGPDPMGVPGGAAMPGFAAPSDPGGNRSDGRIPLLDLMRPSPVPPVEETPVEPSPDAAAVPEIEVPELNSYAPAQQPNASQALGDLGEITLAAQLTETSDVIPKGVTWRIFSPDPGADGKLTLVAEKDGGAGVFSLAPGSYLVHAAYGRAGATKRIHVTREARRESLVLDAGGLKLDAVLSGGAKVPADKLRFSIFDEVEDASGERGLIIPDVSPGTIVRLNAGTYQVVSTYGNINAVIRADIRVESGQLTEAIVEHKAAQLTLKLVRDAGGEAIADTSWSVLTSGGDLVTESVGAFASMVLAEGDYSVVAKNRDRIYTREFSVVAGRNQDVEVLATESAAVPAVPD